MAIGLAGSMMPFLGYFSSNDPLRSAALIVHLSDLPQGSVVVTDRPELRVFIVRTRDDEVAVLGVPLKDDAVLMPDGTWSQPMRPCQDFGPDSANGRLIDQGHFSCHDADLTDYQRSSWVWDYDGKYAGPPNYRFADMLSLKFERRGEEIVIRMR